MFSEFRREVDHRNLEAGENVTGVQPRQSKTILLARLSPPVIAAALVCFLFLLRLPGALLPFELDPDESQMYAQALKFRADPVPWRSVDTTTSGPLNSYALVPVSLLASHRYEWLHIMASLLVCLQVLVAYRTLLRLVPKNVAAGGALALVLCFGLAARPNYLHEGNSAYVHYSSELVAALLLTLGFHCFVVWLDGVRDGSRAATSLPLILSGVTLGAAPWGKLQALPISGVLGIVFLIDIWRAGNARRLQRAIAFLIAAAAPSGAMLGIVYSGGAIADFWYAYVVGNLSYAGQEPWSTTLFDALRAFVYAQVRPIFCITAAAAGLFGYGRLTRKGRAADSRWSWELTRSLLYAAAALFAVCRPARFFPHYTVFLLVPLTYVAATLASRGIAMLRGRGEPVPRLLLAGGTAMALLICAVYGVNAIRYARFLPHAVEDIRHPQADANAKIVAVVHQLDKLQPVRSISIWGWTAGVYVLTGIPPATRDATNGTFAFTSKSMPQAYYWKRYAADVRAAKPDLFIDSTAGGTFWLTGTEHHNYEANEDLKQLIDREYIPVAELALKPLATPVRFYRRRELSRSSTN
jgi:hypothetical protein